MRGLKLAKYFGILSLATLAAGCTANSGGGSSYGGPGLPPSSHTPYPTNEAMVDEATQQRIQTYREKTAIAAARAGQTERKCRLTDRFDDDTGIISYQLNDRANLALGIKGDGTDAGEQGGDVNIRLTINTTPHQTHKDKCRGASGSEWRGIVPSLLREGPGVVSSPRSVLN